MKKIKKILAACTLSLFIPLVSVFRSFAAPLETDVEKALIESAVVYLEQIASLTESEIDMYSMLFEAQGQTVEAEGFSQWKSLMGTVGEYTGVKEAFVSENPDGTYVISVAGDFSNEPATMVLTMSSDLGQIKALTFVRPQEEEKTLGSKMKEASSNLVVGMGTVFLVLIFLCWVISLFGKINKLENKLKDRKDANRTAAMPEAPKAAVPEVTVLQKPHSDEELRAVIAAAIAAYESEEGCPIVKQAALDNGINVKTYRRR